MFKPLNFSTSYWTNNQRRFCKTKIFKVFFKIILSAIISVGGDNLIGFCGRKKMYATKNAYQAGLLASKKFVLQNCLTLNSEYQNLESKFFGFAISLANVIFDFFRFSFFWRKTNQNKTKCYYIFWSNLWLKFIKF